MIFSGDILTLNLMKVERVSGRNRDVKDNRGIECSPSPGCVPIECQGDACSQSDNKFQIIKRDDSDSRNTIRGRNIILLRSMDRYSHWLDCTDSTVCTISECKEDKGYDLNNASYVSSCVNHRFRIEGKRRGSKVLNVNNTLQFKSIQHNVYIKCGRKYCGTSCTSNNCTDIFKATKHYDY